MLDFAETVCVCSQTKKKCAATLQHDAEQPVRKEGCMCMHVHTSAIRKQPLKVKLYKALHACNGLKPLQSAELAFPKCSKLAEPYLMA